MFFASLLDFFRVCQVSTVYILYCAHLWAKCSLDISNFPEEISSFYSSVFSSSFMHCSSKKAFLSLLAILWNSTFSWRYLSFSPLLFTSLLSSGLSWWLKKVKRLPTLQETPVQSLGLEDPLKKEMATHSSTLAWKIPWMEEPGGLQSMGSQRVIRHD